MIGLFWAKMANPVHSPKFLIYTMWIREEEKYINSTDFWGWWRGHGMGSLVHSRGMGEGKAITQIR